VAGQYQQCWVVLWIFLKNRSLWFRKNSEWKNHCFQFSEKIQSQRTTNSNFVKNLKEPTVFMKESATNRQFFGRFFAFYFFLENHGYIPKLVIWNFENQWVNEYIPGTDIQRVCHSFWELPNTGQYILNHTMVGYGTKIQWKSISCAHIIHPAQCAGEVWFTLALCGLETLRLLKKNPDFARQCTPNFQFPKQQRVSKDFNINEQNKEKILVFSRSQRLASQSSTKP